MSALSYTPAPNEQAYFFGLFQSADVQHSGNIGGAQAVAFFARSKLPIEVLKNIWTVADQPSTNSLTIHKFAVAVRLIQLTQNGQKGQGPNLAAPPGVVLRPPFFEGVSGVSVPLPPVGGQPPQQQQQQPPPTPQRQQPPQQQLQAPPTPSRPGPGMQPQQQQQAPPTPGMGHPSMQPQQQQQAPPTPGMGQQGMPPLSPTKSRALTQDPYSLPPHEKGRYEGLFVQYAKEDGYVYGKEAVELFMKSGVNQGVLRDIWNMVDYPVDNRLDKLEFALAMHLIVCVSKKKLPIPPNGLPLSLKMLKQQQREQDQAAARPATPQQAPSPGAPPQAGGQQQQQGRIPSPGPPQQQMQQHVGYDMGNQEANRSRMGSYQSADMSRGPGGGINVPPSPSYNQPTPGLGPPSLTGGLGGMDISDAFEGLNTGPSDMSSLPSYVPEPEHQMSQPEPYSAPAPAPPQRSPAAQQPPVPAVQTAPEPPKSTQALASNYDMGDNVQELEKLRSVLQRLQAENISLKAHLGSMSEDEKEVQKELGATVAEIGTLSNSLITLRSQVLAAKTKLMEASAELKAAREKKGAIMDMISEVRETKTSIEEATISVQKATDATQSAPAPPANAPRNSDIFGGDLFGFESPKPAAPTVPSNDDAGDDVSRGAVSHENIPDPGSAQNQYPATNPSYQSEPVPVPSLPAVTTVDSSDLSGHGQDDTDGADAYGKQSTEPPIQMTLGGHGRQPSEPPLQVLSGHNRRDSNPFASDMVMGGAPPPFSQPDGISPHGATFSEASNFSQDNDDDREEEDGAALKTVDEIKRKLALAEATAQDASAVYRKLMAQCDELRTDADRAEAHAVTLKAQADEKKKGTFGGGKKKKLLKEAERAAADSEDIKKRFMAVQTQANEAQSVLMETKREVDKLRNEAEQAELDAVQMASLREQEQARRKEEQEAQRKAAAPSEPQGYQESNGFSGQQKGQAPNGAPYGGYGAPQGMPAAVPPAGEYGQPMGYGQSAPPASMGYSQSAPPALDQNIYSGGFSQQQEGMGGFGSGVMIGGGDDRFDLPSPDQLPAGQNSDPYSNPFGY